MVFARYIAFILSTYLGKFIKGLNKNSVNFSLLRGSFELKNVELANDLLSFSDHLQLERGTIGSLSVSIPWHSLYSRRCEVVIRDVVVVVAPRYDRVGSSTALFKSTEEFRAAVQAVLADDAPPDDKQEKEVKSGFLHRLSQTVLKNLAFRLENISFRLEDSTGCWRGSTAGIQAQIGKVSCEATDKSFNPVFIRPEEQASTVSIYRLISYEAVTLRLLHATSTTSHSESTTAANSTLLASGNRADAEEVMRSAEGALTVAWESPSLPERPEPFVAATLVIRDSVLGWNPRCITALGILFEGVRRAPQRAYAWDKRPRSRVLSNDRDSVAQWWQYALCKAVAHQKAIRQRNRFDWEHYLKRKQFLSSFLHYCYVLLKAPWIGKGVEASVDEGQLCQTPVHEVMACWNAARWYVKEYEKCRQPPEGTLYQQLLQHYSIAAAHHNRDEQAADQLPFALADVELTVECARLTARLDDNLQSVVTDAFVSASKKGQNLFGQVSLSSVVVIEEDADTAPLLSIDGGDAAALMSISKVGTNPMSGSLVIETVATCLDVALQELLIAKLFSYIDAVKPFLHTGVGSSRAATAQQSPVPDKKEKKQVMQQVSTFEVRVRALSASADGVVLRVQAVDTSLSPDRPIVVRIQEVALRVNDATIAQLCSIVVSPAMRSGATAISVVTDSAMLSTNVEAIEYVKLLLLSTTTRLAQQLNNVVLASSSFYERPSTSGSDVAVTTNSAPVELSICFQFIECGALALESFTIGATLSEGWHIHLSAAGGTTEGWCHSVPPSPLDPFIDIHVWADAFLSESPFAGSIEDNGIAFLFTLHHVTLCLGDELAATFESLLDLIMLIIFADEDRHISLRDDVTHTIPHISGRLVGSDVKLLLESDGGDLTLLPGYAASMESEEARRAFSIPPPPPPLTIELAGNDCIDLTLHRYGDKRMDIALTLQSGVNAYLRGTPAHIPLLPRRAGACAEVEFHISAPSEADLPIFAYTRIDIALRLFDAAVVAHIPTIMALWTNFNTPSLPLGRIRNIGNRVHFTCRPSRPGKTLAPRSPLSAAVEAVGEAALARSSPFARVGSAGARADAADFTLPAPSAIYTMPVFPSDVTLRVDIVRSELYYPWGEGCVAPLFLHAVVPTCSVVVSNRDECVEVSVRGTMEMPSVAATFCRPEYGGEGSSDSGETSEASQHATAAPAADGNATAGLRAAFPDGRSQSADATLESSDCAVSSSSLGVHVTFTMDSRPPFRPGSSRDSLLVSLSGTPAPGSGALPGPLHICLDDPASVAAWLTFFTFFNPANTVPLSSSEATVFSSAMGAAAESAAAQPGEREAGQVSPAASPPAATPGADTTGGARNMTTRVQLSPIVFHLPLAGLAAALWDGVAFTAAPGGNALLIPSIDVVVHDTLRSRAAFTRSPALSTLTGVQELCDGGFAVLKLRGSGSSSSSSSGGAVPAVLLETTQSGPAAADVRRRLIVPGLQGHVGQHTSLKQLQLCGTLPAISAVLAARSAQCALLNAVIERESRRLGLQYACCPSTPQGSTVEAQLRPYLSLPMVMVFQNVCCAYEWESGLQRDVRAGVTVALHNVRLNDYTSYNDACKRGNPEADDYPLSSAMPFLLEVALVDTYVWWTLKDVDVAVTVQQPGGLRDDSGAASAASPPPSQLSRSTDEREAATAAMEEAERHTNSNSNSKHERRSAPLSSASSSAPAALVGTCLPLLLHPVHVRTAIASGEGHDGSSGGGGGGSPIEHADRSGRAGVTTHRSSVTGNGGDDGAGSSWSNDSTAATANVAGSPSATAVHKEEERSLERSRSDSSTAAPHAASTASFHTMPSTTTTDDDADGSAEAPSPTLPRTAAPVVSVSPVHVVLSTSAYVVLSDALLHKRNETAASAGGRASATTAVADTATASATAPVIAIDGAWVYYLSHPEVVQHGRRGVSSPLSWLGQQASAGTAAHSPSASSFSSHLHDDAAKAFLEDVWCTYYFHSEEQRTTVERVSVCRANTLGSRGMMATAATAANDRTAEHEGDAGDGVAVIPLSAVHAIDGLLSTSLSAQLEAAGLSEQSAPHHSGNNSSSKTSSSSSSSRADKSDGRLRDLDAGENSSTTDASLPRSPASAMARSNTSLRQLPLPDVTPQQQQQKRVPPITVVTPCGVTSEDAVVPTVAVIPRLLSRLELSDVCVRLVLLQDSEESFTIVGEAREFWQRYTALHTSARRSITTATRPTAAGGAAGTLKDLPCVSALTFVTTCVPALRGLLTLSSALASAWSRGSSSVNPSRPRPPSSASPAALLEEHCVDALCLQLHGVVASTYTDARAVAVAACVCTSVKSPSRPLLALTQAEVYVPTTHVTYPSMAAAERAVSRDLSSGAHLPTASEYPPPPAAAAVAAGGAGWESGWVPGGGVDGSRSAPATSSSPTSTQRPSRQETELHGEKDEPAQPPPSQGSAAVTPAPTSTRGDGGPSTATARPARGRQVTMMGEVGCRLASITVDVSAAALRAWLGCLVEQPVAALRAAAEEREKWVAAWSSPAAAAALPAESNKESGGSTSGVGGESGGGGPWLTEAASLLRWQPGRGLRIHEALDAIWSLEHDITLSRDGLVLYFSSHATNLMTVMLNGHSIRLDDSLLQQPDGLQRTVMVIQSGLTVRLVGSGRVLLPLGMWSPSLWDSKGNSSGVEAVLLPFMAIGEGSYLECVNVRLGFSEPANGFGSAHLAAGAMHTAGVPARAVAPSPPQRTTAAPPRPPPLVHRSVHLVLSHLSLVVEPRQESRQVHIRTAVELRMSVLGRTVLRDDVRCTGLTVASESVFDAATSTARTTVLAPVDVSVCSSNNGRHHAVSVGAAQVDLGRTDLLLLSTYAGELQAVRSYAKYLTHSRVEKEFLELVEVTLAWRAAAPVDVDAAAAAAATQKRDGTDGAEREDNSEDGDDDGEDDDDVALVGEMEDGGADNDGAPQGTAGQAASHGVRASRTDREGSRRLVKESPRLAPNEQLFDADRLTSTAVTAEASACAAAAASVATEVAAPARTQPDSATRHDGSATASGTIAAIWDSVTSRRSGKAAKTAAAQSESATPRGTASAAPPPPPLSRAHATREDEDATSAAVREPSAAQQGRERRRARRRQQQRTRRLREQASGFSWAVFIPAVELTISDHRYPLLQLSAQDLLLRRTSTSALDSTSLARCQKASVDVYGRGRWDAVLLPSAALTWAVTQSVSRHSSNRHARVHVDGIHVQSSHLIVAKLLYISRQIRLLLGSLQRRLAMAAVAFTGERAATALLDLAAAPAPVDTVSMDWPCTPSSPLVDTDTTTTAAAAAAAVTGGRRRGGAGRTTDSEHSSSSASSNSSSSSSSTHSSNSSDDNGSDDDKAASLRATAALQQQQRSRPRPSQRPRASAVVADSTPSSRATRVEPSVTAATTAGGGGGGGGGHVSVPVGASMATHRLLNSFRRTLFAGICEREVVTPASTKAAAATTPEMSVSPPLLHSAHEAVRSPLSVAPALTIWRCKELYRLPPASATDIFVSYRRARSLVLTFFPVGCVEWDDDGGTWVLNATGETDLAAKAAQATRIPTAAAAAAGAGAAGGAWGDEKEGAEGGVDGSAAAAAVANWFPFTTLQYGMVRPVSVRTTTRIEVRRPTEGPPSPTRNEANTAGAATAGGVVAQEDSHAIFSARPRALHIAADNSSGTYRVRTHALALTCVDPEEEAESLRYPIVIPASEAEEAGMDTNGSGGVHSRSRRVASPAESNASRFPSSPLSRQPLSGYSGAGVLGDRAAAGAATSGSRPYHHQRQSSQLSTLGVPSQLRRRQGSAPGFPAPSASESPPHHHQSYRHHHHHQHHHHAQQPQQPYSSSTAAAGAAAAVEDSGDGDLLVVRIQARSSLLNETGCTLQLHSLASARDAASSTAAAATTEAAEGVDEGVTTVPPGWRLPLEEEDVQGEVLLRVCCPSARWAPAAAHPRARRGTSDGGGEGASEGRAQGHHSSSSSSSSHHGSEDSDEDSEDSTAFSSASANSWYEARLVLGDLDSGRFLSLSRVPHRRSAADGPPSPSSLAGFDAFDDQDRRPLILFVVVHYSSEGLIEHISLYPRLTLVNHLGVRAKVAVFQQDPNAGPQTPDEAVLLAPWTAPYVGRRGHARQRELFHRSLVALGAHDSLPHQHALPLHFCTYSSNLVLGLSFSQSTGDSLFTADLEPVISYLREAVDHHPRILRLHDSHGRTFAVQVSVMPRTVVLSVALWVYNLTEYPLLLSDSLVTRRLSPGQSSTTGIIPSQGEPFLIGCRLADFTQGFFAIGLDGGWSGAVPIDVGSSGVFVSAQSHLGIHRSCNYSILFPNAQEGRPMVIQVTPRWVYYNNTQKRLRVYFRFPGLAKAMHEAVKRRQRLLALAMESATAADSAEAGQERRHQLLRQADDNVSTLKFMSAVQLNPGDYHVSCIGPIDGNQFCVQDVLEGVLPSITSISKDNKIEHRDVAAYYESHLTPYMDVDRPGEATFNLWAAPRAPGKRMAVSCGGDLIVQRPVFPHPTWLEPYDPYATDAVITGRIAVEVQNTDNVLTVLLQPIQGTKILLQNRTSRDTVMVRQQGSRRRNRIPPRQNRFFLWEDARQEHVIRVHLMGYKGRWFDVNFSGGECQVAFHVDHKAAAEAEALAAAQLAHPHPTHVKSAEAPHRPFSFFVRGYTNLEKTRVTIVVTESAIPLYAAIDSWRTSAALSLQVSMVQLSWMQETSAGAMAAAAEAMHLAIPFGAAADSSVVVVVDGPESLEKARAGSGGSADALHAAAVPSSSGAVDRDMDGQLIVVESGSGQRGRGSSRNRSSSSPRQASPLLRRVGMSASATRRRVLRSAFGLASGTSPFSGRRSNNNGSSSSGSRSRDAAAAVLDSPSSFTSNPLLVSVILEGLQLERLSTEDTETFFFAIHQMQWVDEKEDAVFVYRARPRLPPLPPSSAAAASGSGAAGDSSHHLPAASATRRPGQPQHHQPRRRRVVAEAAGSSSSPRSPSPPRRREQLASLLPRAAVAATRAANRVLDTLFGQSDAFLLAMEKPNDVEFSYNFIKYADGVTRFTELRCVVTPLVVVLTDYRLVDIITEVRRLRVLLGLRKQASATQTTTIMTAPMTTIMRLTAPPQPQRRQKARERAEGAPPTAASHGPANGDDADGSVLVVVAKERDKKMKEKKESAAPSSALSRLDVRAHRRRASDVMIAGDDDELPPPSSAVPAVVAVASSRPAVVAPLTAEAERSHPLQASLPRTLSVHSSSGSANDVEDTDTPLSTSADRTSWHAVIKPSRRSSAIVAASTVTEPGNEVASQHTMRSTTANAPLSSFPAAAAHTGVSRPPLSAAESTITSTSTTPTQKAVAVPAAGTTAKDATERRPRLRVSSSSFVSSTARRQRRHRLPSQPPSSSVNTTGFVSQGVFLVQLVHEVRARLQRQGTGLMAGSLAAIATNASSGGRRGRAGAMNLLRGVGGGGNAGGGGAGGVVGNGVHRRQMITSTVRHHRGVVQRGGVGDGLAGAAAAAAAAAAAGGGGGGESDVEASGGGVGGAGSGPGTAVAGAPTTPQAVTATTATATSATPSNVNTASFMFIERLEVQRITLYVTFQRHSPDPLRPILGAYAWMLPSQLDQREFHLPAWTLTRQVETVASLQARLVRWGMHSLREQWTKVTKLGTLLDALQFWQHRTPPLHGPPRVLTLTAVQRQRQAGEGRPLVFAPCASSSDDDEEEDEEEERHDGGRWVASMGSTTMPPLSPRRSGN